MLLLFLVMSLSVRALGAFWGQGDGVQLCQTATVSSVSYFVCTRTAPISGMPSWQCDARGICMGLVPYPWMQMASCTLNVLCVMLLVFNE